MRFKLSNPTAGDAYSFYVNAFTADVEAQVNRMGPAELVTASLDQAGGPGPNHGWPTRVNTLLWPRGADTFAACILTLTDAQADLVEASVAAQAAAWTEGDPRPYLVLSAILAPAEAGRAGETYAPAGITDPVEAETELIAWKLYPLAPVRLPEADGSDAYGGLWLLPLVDARYFWRLTPLYSDGSGSGSGDGSYHVIDAPTPAAYWMPPLRAYPDDAAEPAHYAAIEWNGTHRGAGPDAGRGAAADAQAAMENWRVVCRDVRTSYNATPLTGTPHDAFAGVLADYPDDPAATESYDLDAARLAGAAGALIAGGAADPTLAKTLTPQKVHVLFPVAGDDAYWELLIRKDVADPTATTDLSEDDDGPTDAERDHLPRAVLGVECNRRRPNTADRARLLAAAKRWVLLYHLWRRRQAYYKFAGVAPVVPNGYAALIVWNFTADDLSTLYVAHQEADGTGRADAAAGSSSSSSGPDRVRFLKIISDLSETTGRYLALVQRQENLPAQWVDEDLAWLLEANDDDLVVGHRYLARAGDKYQGLTTWATFCCGSGTAARTEDGDGDDDDNKLTSDGRVMGCKVCGSAEDGYATYKVPGRLWVVVRPTTEDEWQMILDSGIGTQDDSLDCMLNGTGGVAPDFPGGPVFDRTTLVVDHDGDGWPVAVTINPGSSVGTGNDGPRDPAFVLLNGSVVCAYDGRPEQPDLSNGARFGHYFEYTGNFASVVATKQLGSCAGWTQFALSNQPAGNFQWTLVTSLQPLRATIILYPGTVALDLYGPGVCL